MRNNELIVILNNTPYLEAGQVFHKLDAPEIGKTVTVYQGVFKSIDELPGAPNEDIVPNHLT